MLMPSHTGVVEAHVQYLVKRLTRGRWPQNEYQLDGGYQVGKGEPCVER